MKKTELLLSVSPSITLNLNKIISGMDKLKINKLATTVAKSAIINEGLGVNAAPGSSLLANVFITGGEGASRLPAGIYFYVSVNLADTIGSFYKTIRSLFQNYLPDPKILEKLGSSLEVGLGVYISTDSLGLSIRIYGNEIKCYITWNPLHFKCSIGGKVIEGLRNFLSGVYTHSKRVARNIGAAFTNASDATYNWFAGWGTQNPKAPTSPIKRNISKR